MVQRFFTRVLMPVFLLTALVAPAFAQGGRVELGGTVLDQGKAVLPGVTITVRNQDTGLERQAVTSGDGRFVIPTLLPGTYTIKAELQGFETTTRHDQSRQLRQPDRSEKLGELPENDCGGRSSHRAARCPLDLLKQLSVPLRRRTSPRRLSRSSRSFSGTSKECER